MHFRIVSFLMIILSIVLYSCSSTPTRVVVAKYGNYDITLDEFKDAYQKSTGEKTDMTRDSLKAFDDFLNLYTNFKMKLRDAEVRGYDKDPEVINELNSYIKQIGRTYIIEKDLNIPGIENLYEKRKFEIRISHIMVRTDTISAEAAELKARKLIEKLNNGENFEQLAKEYSDDPYSRDYGGDLYFYTAGELQPVFEDAIYNTPVGSIYPQPLRSGGGYHIFKVTGKRERIPQVRARHILVSYKAGGVDSAKADTLHAFLKIKSILEQIKNGVDFDEMAKKYSDDKSTSGVGGDLGFFPRRRTVKPFDETVFNLDIGEVSEIVQTNFGFHIIQLLEKKKYPTFEEEKDNLRNVYNAIYFKADLINYIGKLKKELGFIQNVSGIEYVFSKIDSLEIKSDFWDGSLRNDLKDLNIFFVQDKPYVFDSVIVRAVSNPQLHNKIFTRETMNDLIDKYAEDLLFYEKSELLDKTDEPFAKLMGDYKNGILIFKLHEEEIWNKVKFDDEQLKELYETTKENYWTSDMIRFSEIFVRQDSLIKLCDELIKQGVSFDSLAVKYTQRKGYKERAGAWDLMTIAKSEIAKKADSLVISGTISEPFKIWDGWAIIRLDERVPARIKTFEEAKPELATNYQEIESKRLENEYINRLKQIYKPELYYNVLEKLY